jgi:hypothetical protein
LYAAKEVDYRLKRHDCTYIKSELPENFSTNFKGNEIKLVFDENIKLKT